MRTKHSAIRFLTRLLLCQYLFLHACSVPTIQATTTPSPTLTPTSTLTPTATPTETHTPTLTNIATPTITLSPMPTEIPLDLYSFIFPLDVNEIKLEQPPGSTPIEFKIATRDKDDPCGGHAGDIVSPVGLLNSPWTAPNILVYSPYDAVVYDICPAGGGGLTVVLSLGRDESGVEYFLDIAHIDKFYYDVGDEISNGQLIAEMDTWRIHGDYYEMQLHLGLARDFSGFPHPENYQIIAEILLPEMLSESKKFSTPVLFTYEGPNFCNMSSSEKINALFGYLEKAGFSIMGNDILSGDGQREILFTWYQWDYRSILISPN